MDKPIDERTLAIPNAKKRDGRFIEAFERNL